MPPTEISNVARGERLSCITCNPGPRCLVDASESTVYPWDMNAPPRRHSHVQLDLDFLGDPVGKKKMVDPHRFHPIEEKASPNNEPRGMKRKQTRIFPCITLSSCVGFGRWTGPCGPSGNRTASSGFGSLGEALSQGGAGMVGCLDRTAKWKSTLTCCMETWSPKSLTVLGWILCSGAVGVT